MFVDEEEEEEKKVCSARVIARRLPSSCFMVYGPVYSELHSPCGQTYGGEISRKTEEFTVIFRRVIGGLELLLSISFRSLKLPIARRLLVNVTVDKAND